jgi:hypothetical protein
VRANEKGRERGKSLGDKLTFCNSGEEDKKGRGEGGKKRRREEGKRGRKEEWKKGRREEGKRRRKEEWKRGRREAGKIGGE